MVMKVVSGSRSPTLIVIGGHPFLTRCSRANCGYVRAGVLSAANLGASARQAKSPLVEAHAGLARPAVADKGYDQLLTLELLGIAAARKVDPKANATLAIVGQLFRHRHEDAVGGFDKNIGAGAVAGEFGFDFKAWRGAGKPWRHAKQFRVAVASLGLHPRQELHGSGERM